MEEYFMSPTDCTDFHRFFYENIEKHISEIRVVLITDPLYLPLKRGH